MDKVKVYLECLRPANAVSPPADVVVRADRYYEATLAKLATDSAASGSPSETPVVKSVTAQAGDEPAR